MIVSQIENIIGKKVGTRYDSKSSPTLYNRLQYIIVHQY